MIKLFKYLLESKASVLAIIALLILQAFSELSLPQYTSNIVDVGIQQKGIEDSIPKAIRVNELEGLKYFMTEEEVNLVEQSYQLISKDNLIQKDYDKYVKEYPLLENEPLYILNNVEEETHTALDEAMGITYFITTMLSKAETMNSSPVIPMEAGQRLDNKTLLDMREKILDSQGDLSESMIHQMGVASVIKEYEAIGIDLVDIQMNYLWRTGGKMLLVSVVMMGAAILVGLISSKVGAKIGMNLRRRVFQKVVSFSNTEMDQFSTSSLITRSTNDIQQVQQVSIILLRMVAYSPILGIGGILKVANTRTGMGWIIGVAVGIVVSIVMVLVAISMPKFKLMQTLVDRLNLVSREILTGLPVIRAFSRERFEEQRFDVANQDLMKTQLFTNRVMTFMMPMMMFIMNVVTVAIVWFGAKGIDAGNLQVGDMMAFITYTMQIIMSFLMLTMISIMLPRAGVAANRIHEVVTTEPTIKDNDSSQTERVNMKDMKGEITFHNVAFRYPGAKEDALKGINFTASPGKTTAIIGSTGCGKSTLLHLIPRFYDVTEGEITIDGIDIRTIEQKQLRELLGFVPQKGILFSGTIESNLKFADPDISDEQMERATKIAQAMDFINENTEKYQSNIAQGGTNVSGGQKQRLSIARAIAKNPKVYLFDDSFSALDYKTDVALRKALNGYTKDSTVIIVAQRINTILHADQILVLEDGKIVGMGNHTELLSTCEAYQEIAKSQLSEEELKGGHNV